MGSCEDCVSGTKIIWTCGSWDSTPLHNSAVLSPSGGDVGRFHETGWVPAYQERCLCRHSLERNMDGAKLVGG